MTMIKDLLTLRLALSILHIVQTNLRIYLRRPHQHKGGGREYLCWQWSEVDAAATGFPYNTASNLWETQQSLLCSMKILKLNETGIVNYQSALSVYSLGNWCPRPTQYAATAFGSGTACTWGWDYPQFIIPIVWQFQSFAKQSFAILIGLSLTDRCCQQSSNDASPQSMVLLLDFHDKTNRCSIAMGCTEANN